MRVSQDCSHRISQSFAKLQEFTVLAKDVFDDGELNRLIADIRKDINETKNQLDYLQSRCEPKQKHTENIVSILQRKLANVTSDFKSTLEKRSRNVQKLSARQEMFYVPSSSSTSMMPSHQLQTNNSSPSSGGAGTVVLDLGGAGPSSQSSYYQHQQHPSHIPQHQQQQQQLFMNGQIDMSDRADKMQLIESTIVELGTVFNQLAHIVQDQGETITRIDMNISETTANVEAAHDALLRYFASINSNRWLILKVFGVLFFFFIIFVVFAG